MSIVGTVDKTKAQVTRGGLSTDEFNPDSLASYKYPTLLAAGECLNIDGPCGGYNLHWAWASGITAGSTAARLVSS
jgi:predicted flavoprotein YhiN